MCRYLCPPGEGMGMREETPPQVHGNNSRRARRGVSPPVNGGEGVFSFTRSPDHLFTHSLIHSFTPSLFSQRSSSCSTQINSHAPAPVSSRVSELTQRQPS